jgi:tetratricopeptide (TPR) repeat protein
MDTHPAGARLGPYEVVSQPLAGDTCLVYVCYDHVRAQPVVLKTLQREYANPAARDRFAQAGRAWASLGTHPHIASCYGAFQPEGAPELYLVLQLVIWAKDRADASLRSWLAPGQPLPALQALLFALQIARGMQHVATKSPGFVHGDLCPENVLVGDGRLPEADLNRLRVTNFWLARVPREGSRQGDGSANGIAATALYRAPEQRRGEKATAAADVYALGCMLCEMLSGQPLVTGRGVADLPSLPSGLPTTVDELVARCTATEPEKRYGRWDAVETAIASAYHDTAGYPVPPAGQEDVLSQAERTLLGRFCNEMGSLCVEVGRSDTAAACFEQALWLGRAEGDQRLIAGALGNMGEMARRLGDARQAIEYHEQALRVAQEGGHRQAEAIALANAGTSYLQLGNPRQAAGHLERALTMTRELGDRQGEAMCLDNLGNACHGLGDLRRAIEYHEQALHIAREIGLRRGESAALGNLGAIYADLGDVGRAVRYQEESLAIKHESGDRHGQIANLNNLGNAYRDLGLAAQATEYYQQALAIARDLRDRHGEASVLNNMASNCSSAGEMRRAVELHEQALAIFGDVGDVRNQGVCLTNLGFVYMKKGDIRRALATCEQALAIDRQIGDEMGLALDSFNMANLLVQQGRHAEALPYAEQAARLMARVGHAEKAGEAGQLVAEIRQALGRR